MKRATILVLAVVAAAVAAAPLPAGDAVSVTGEVIDSACYIKGGAKGAGHRGCAQACADAGIPLALLEDGTDQLIWLASKDDAKSPTAELKPHAGHKVTVTGSYAERGGAKIPVIDSIKAAG